VNGKFFYRGRVGQFRPWLLEKYDRTELLEAGFDFQFPQKEFKDRDNSEIRLFSLWKNGAALEANYFNRHPWRKKGEA